MFESVASKGRDRLTGVNRRSDKLHQSRAGETETSHTTAAARTWYYAFLVKGAETS